MTVHTILYEACVGERRWVALNEQDLPLSIHIERASDAFRALYGQVYTAKVMAIRKDQGGAFIQLENGADAFLRLTPEIRLTEGQVVRVVIASEARRDKLARAALAEADAVNRDRFEAWHQSLPDGASAKVIQVAPGDATIGEAVDEALADQVTLAGGGTLRIEGAAALTAADIDTAGRLDKGRAAVRALNVNRTAARELARQIELRRIGGLVVLDCIAPLNKESADKIRKAFKAQLSVISSRDCQTLPVSRFGLMEISLSHQETPLRDLMLQKNGQMTPETKCLEGIRALEREAVAAPMGRFTLYLSKLVLQWAHDSGVDFQRQLDQQYGARLQIKAHDKNISQVSRL